MTISRHDFTDPHNRDHLRNCLDDPHTWDLTEVAEALGCPATKEAIGAALLAWDETTDDERLRAEVIEERGREWWS